MRSGVRGYNLVPLANDPCPQDFWVEVSHLEAAEPKGCGYVKVSAVPYDTETEVECNTRDVLMAVFDSNVDGLFFGDSAGVWNESTSTSGGGGIGLDLSECTYALEHTVPNADLATLGTIRLIARSTERPWLGLSQAWPSTVKVKVGDDSPD